MPVKYGYTSAIFRMEQYTFGIPLIAIRQCPSGDSDKSGVISSLPSDAIVEIRGPSGLARGMVEVAWKHQRFAVLQRDLATRATLVRTAAVGD